MNISLIPAFKKQMLLCLAAIFFTGCAGVPRNPKNVCEIFRENQDWYRNAYESYQRWGVPVPVMMAIMYHESGFRSDARPPRTKCLFIFPGPRPSTAYGYPQALDSTWANYKQSAGAWGADRNDFDDAVDFVGWYCYQSHIRCGIDRKDAYNLYLAYHEGQRGFREGTYLNKAWLKQTAAAVQQRADFYAEQMAGCEKEFQRDRGGCCLWPF